MNPEWKCIYEERFSKVEADVAEINARLDSKKEDIQSINKQLLYDHQQQTELIENVARLVVLVEEGGRQRSINNSKLDELEKKIDKLQEEIVSNKDSVAESANRRINKLQEEVSANKETVTELTSSLNSFRNTMLALIPIISIAVGVLLHFIKI